MPALVVCGCRWGVGSDDFVFAGGLALLIRTGWMVASAVVLGHHLNSDSIPPPCKIYDDVTIFIGFLLADLIVQSVIQFLIICISGRGGMTTNHAKRDEQVARLVVLQLVLFVLESAWVVLGSVWAFSNDSNCDKTITETRGLIITGYIWITIFTIKLFCNADPVGCFHQRNVDEEQRYSASERSWEKCCRFFCCVADVGNGRRGVILDVARIFASLFTKTGITNMVATDCAAAMALVQFRQEHEEQEHKKSCSNASQTRPYSGVLGEWQHPCIPLNFNDTQQQNQQQLYRDSCYYMKYALAAYGWPLLMLMHLGTGICRLAPNCRCCTCCREHATPNDHCVECNTSAILHQTGLDRDEIIHVTYHNKAYEPPYFVAVDKEKQSIIISIRGTMSVSDALTDLTANPEEFGDASEPLHAHGGIYKAALYVKSQLEQSNEEGQPGLLHRAFNYAKDKDPTREYRLVITGHSLGAGTASILSLLLENQHPGLACFAYSPPGGLLSLPAVELTKKFTTSVVLGKDLVPRLSLEKAHELFHTMKCEADKSRTPKWLIQLRCLCTCCCCKCCRQYVGEMPYDEEEGDQTPINAHRNSGNFTANENEVHTGGITLHLPGNIIYLVEGQDNKNKKSYRAFWTDHREFHTLLVGAAMIKDHLPHHVHAALHQFLTKYDNRTSRTTRL
jgi:sn1-specific diacylglycerol lipase